jgi:glycosyltransferase involved in cell wall biosynthesis
MDENLEQQNLKNNCSTKLRIVHLSWEYPPAIWGGLGTFATEITKKQAKLGNEVTVFAINNENKLKISDEFEKVKVYRPKIPNISSSFFLFSNNDLKSWGSNFNFFSDVIGYNLLTASKLTGSFGYTNEGKYDIIDCHDWLGILGGIIAKKDLNIPLIFHVHSTEVGRSCGGGSNTIKNIEYEGSQIADCIITVSYAMKEELIKFGYPKNKIRVCWNGIDPDKYNPKRISEFEIKKLRNKYKINDEDHLLFFIGRLVTVKGVINLIKAMPNVIEEFPKTKLLILGTGDLENEIIDIINNLNLNENIILRNEFVSEKERINHYAAANTVVLPSLYEPFGIVCTEAMSMQKPVVVGANGTNGMREQIIAEGENKCGVHINPNNPNDISWGIKQILKSEDQGLNMGINARKRAINDFNWDIVNKKTLDIYREFLNK